MEDTPDHASNSVFPLLWENSPAQPQGTQVATVFGAEVVHLPHQDLSMPLLTSRVRVSSVFPRDLPSPKTPPPYFQDTIRKTLPFLSISTSKGTILGEMGGCPRFWMDIRLRRG